MICMMRIALLCFLTLSTAESKVALARITQKDTQFFTFFLDKPPTKAVLALLPPTARDVIIARVRIVEGPNYFATSRDELYGGKYFFGVRLAVTSILKGQTKIAEKYDVKFGIRGTNISLYSSPHTPRQKAQEYFIASYVADDMERLLVAFPVSSQEFGNWSKENSEYEQLRIEQLKSRPAAKP